VRPADAQRRHEVDNVGRHVRQGVLLAQLARFSHIAIVEDEHLQTRRNECCDERISPLDHLGAKTSDQNEGGIRRIAKAFIGKLERTAGDHPAHLGVPPFIKHSTAR